MPAVSKVSLIASIVSSCVSAVRYGPTPLENADDEHGSDRRHQENAQKCQGEHDQQHAHEQAFADLRVAALRAARALSDDAAHASARRAQRSSKLTRSSMPNDAKSMTAAIAVAPA